MSDLRDHLESFGFKHFIDDEYWNWGGQEISKLISDKEIERFEKLQRAIQKSPNQNKSAFYDFIASKNMQHIVHSMKYQAIISSGTVVDAYISKVKPENVLDFGCNSGYLTSWYAKNHPAISFVGVDISEPSINLARSASEKMGLNNVKYLAGDYQVKLKNQIDLVVDTQTIYEVFNRAKAIDWISNKVLSPNGALLSIAQTGSKQALISYIGDLNKYDLYVKDLNFINFYDLGRPSCYPVIVASKVECQQPNIDEFWDGFHDFFIKM